MKVVLGLFAGTVEGSFAGICWRLLGTQ